MFLMIGKAKIAVRSADEASMIWNQYRDTKIKSGIRPKIREGWVIDKNGVKIHRISWNGRIWDPTPVKVIDFANS